MKAMRKAACYMMAVALLCAVFSMGAMAAEAVIDVESNLVTSGDTTQLVVVVSIPADLEIGGASMRLSYDASKLTVVSSEAGTLPSALVNTENVGEIRGNFFSGEASTTGGVLYTVTFDYAADATADAADISVGKYSLSDINGNTISGVVVNNTFAGETVVVESAAQETPKAQDAAGEAPAEDDKEEALAQESIEADSDVGGAEDVSVPDVVDEEEAQPQEEAPVINDDGENANSPAEQGGDAPAETTISGTRIVLILLCGLVIVLAVAVLCVHVHNKKRPRGKH